MKVTKEHFDQLQNRISQLDTEEVRQVYRDGKFPRADQVKDLNKRYRWDLLWASGLSALITEMYDQGVNDSHIDTALRKIVKEL